MEKMDFTPNRESYTERRQLFKTIWETAMNIDEKEDIMSKPKVINPQHLSQAMEGEKKEQTQKNLKVLLTHRTLRLDEVDKCVIGKKKKQRIKNLRHVCKKILDFCDRQDADDVFYEQVAVEGQVHGPFQNLIEEKPPRKIKTRKYKKKVKKSKSMFAPINEHAQLKATASERNDESVKESETKSRNTSPIRIKKKSFVKNTGKVKTKISPRKTETAGSSSLGNSKHNQNAPPTRRRIVKKKYSKKKKPSDIIAAPPKGILDWPES